MDDLDLFEHLLSLGHDTAAAKIHVRRRAAIAALRAGQKTAVAAVNLEYAYKLRQESCHENGGSHVFDRDDTSTCLICGSCRQLGTYEG